MNIVCITGIDGAGKTTLANNLVSTLIEMGRDSKYLYGRIIPVVSRLFMALGRIFWLNNQDQWRDYVNYSNKKKRIMHNRLLKWMYTSAILFDFYPQLWIKLILNYSKDGIIVVDRYIYDTVISDLCVHLNYSHWDTEKAIQFGLRFIPTPEVTFLLDLPEEIAFQRKTDVPHIEYLKERSYFYRHILARPEVQLINAESSIQESIDQMMGYFNFKNRGERIK